VHRFKISTRIVTGFLFLLVLMTGLTIGSIAQVNQVKNNLAQINQVNSVKQRYAINFRGSVHDRAIAIRDVVILEDPAQVRAQLDLIEKLAAAHAQGALSFFGELAGLADPKAFAAHLAPLRRTEWVVYAKPPFGGPAAVLAYLARYTHRVAISNHRLVRLDDHAVRFRWKDYRTAEPATGAVKIKTMALSPNEFIRRFLLHVLPAGFHRIRHYGFLAKGPHAPALDQLRSLITAQAGEPAASPPEPEPQPAATEPAAAEPRACPCCGGALRLVEVFSRGQPPRSLTRQLWMDSS